MFLFIIDIINFNFLVFTDAPLAWQYTMQDSASPIHEGLLNLYEDIICALVFVLFFVLSKLVWIIYNFIVIPNYNNNSQLGKVQYPKNNSNVFLEFIWTLVPAIFLLFLVFPTIVLIYALDELCGAIFTFKILGHQWYWSYEFGDFLKNGIFIYNVVGDIVNNNTLLTEEINPLIFDSRILLESELYKGHLRLLEVDNRLFLPKDIHIRALITSTDVLHSWTIPSFGVKIDACPGRLNQVSIYIQRCGVFYGQCSEICGINHAFIPICVEVSY